MKILGIDPGYDRLGIAIVEKVLLTKQGRPGGSNKEILIHSECFTTAGGSGGDNIYDRLLSVGQRVRTVIQKYEPDVLSMETLFITKNQKTAMHVSEARGIIAYEARLHGLPIFEYSPPQIKAAITGDGRSDKRQIIKMIPLLLSMEILASDQNSAPAGNVTLRKKHDDEYDAIAVALTCIASNPLK